MQIPKWLIATAALLVVALIAALAFFIGRETSRPPAAAVAASPAPQEPAAISAPVSAPAPGNAIGAPGAPGATASSATEPGPPADNSPAAPGSNDARARVAAYFKQMDAILSAGTTGDSQEFATTLVNAAASGDFSGIDDLVRAAGDAERRAVAVQPPAECAEYHRQAVALLQESRTMVAALRDGLKRNDTDALSSLSASAQNMKSRSENLAQAEKSLRARFGL